MKWSKVFILLFPAYSRRNPRDPLLAVAQGLKERYDIPSLRRFTTHAIPGYCCLSPPHSHYLQSETKPFAECDLNSKLIVIAHGRDHGDAIHHDTFGKIDGASFARMLIDYGLTQIGLISMKACEVGKGVFLPTLVKTLVEEGVKIGWAIGYKSPVELMEEKTAISTGCFDLLIRQCFKLPDNFRIRILQGNAFVIIPDSERFRYR